MRYDAFANRKSQTPSGTGSAPQMSLPFTNPTNRVDPGNNITYDAAGNVTTDNQGQTYTYDAEERISSMTHLGGTPTIYKYDSDGNLLYERGPNTAQIILRNLAGQQLAVYSPDGVPEPFQTTEAYVDGELLGDWNNGAFFFASTDTVGTKRFVSWGWGDLNTGTSPQFLESFTSLPFGDALSSIGSDPMHFTGKMRDVASGNDYFGARYYSSSVGRFMSPDWSAKPEAVPYSSLDNPQSLNLYEYVGNNPLTKADPDGHCPICAAVVDTLEDGLIGGGLGAAVNVGLTAVFNPNATRADYLGAAESGFITGAVAGVTGGDSLGVQVGVNAVANVVGGVVERSTVAGHLSVGSVAEVAKDAVIGAAAPLLAKGFGKAAQAINGKDAGALGKAAEGTHLGERHSASLKSQAAAASAIDEAGRKAGDRTGKVIDGVNRANDNLNKDKKDNQ
jgi:RHS repeat-associated protein